MTETNFCPKCGAPKEYLHGSGGMNAHESTAFHCQFCGLFFTATDPDELKRLNEVEEELQGIGEDQDARRAVLRRSDWVEADGEALVELLEEFAGSEDEMRPGQTKCCREFIESLWLLL